MTQRALAAAVSVTQSAIAHYERRANGKTPGRAIQHAIAGELRVDRSFIWDEDSTPTATAPTRDAATGEGRVHGADHSAAPAHGPSGASALPTDEVAA